MKLTSIFYLHKTKSVNFKKKITPLLKPLNNLLRIRLTSYMVTVKEDFKVTKNSTALILKRFSLNGNVKL